MKLLKAVIKVFRF